MSPNPMRCTFAAGAVVALAMLASPAVRADTAANTAASEKPIVVAQAPTPARTSVAPGNPEAFPAYQRGVRAAAAEGNEALRRYVWRTRMIYNFYYHDFAPKE